MQHGIDSQARNRLDARFVGNVFAVGVNGMDGNIEFVGNLLTAVALGHQYQHFRLAVAEIVVLLGCVVDILAAFT